ncbi:hypothetical protein K461DRAFT_319592 [Myriangium duriaei CBS 260.36]|uniref:Palmitoyltransferase n=1 Tax=Myriangium duriaei CBS 260.36 TaxID=1168546 RepID=A0A9P4J6T7_9PEZI|nr:hypothetical protein K461DRAFT_319592 [Myriangium duriaei CBS 260.36]
MASAGQREEGDGTFFNDMTPGDERNSRTDFFQTDSNDHALPIQGATGPVGEPGLPPSRPVSIGAGNTTRAPLRSNTASPRAGTTSPGLRFSRGSWNPESPRSPNSASRTHVANITSSTFFRPMSSKHLREDVIRAASPPLQEVVQGRPSQETTHSQKGHKTRYSDASIVTMEQSQRSPVDDDVPPLPPSRGGKAEHSPPDQQRNVGSVRSQGSSVPLRPNHPTLSLGAPPSGLGIRTERSPRSFRRSFGWNSRNSREPKELGHRRLDSAPSSPESELEKRTDRANLGRNYEYYNGNYVFFLKGRLLNARQRPLNALTGFLAVLPAALFFAFSASYLWHEVSPAIPITFAYLFWICLLAFLHASFSDPGVLPRNVHPHPRDASDDDPLAIGPSTSNWVMVKSWEQASGEGPTTAMEVPVKFCKSCNIWRPPRAHHCRVCDACIETQDHHCVWLNNCVGRRNYRQFFTFVASATLLAFYLLGASLGHLLVWMNRNNATFRETITSDWTRQGALAMVIYAVLVFPYPASLWGYHVFLTVRGESTRDYLNSQKFLKKDRHRPFDRRSFWRNFVDVLCRPRPPTYMQFKNRYDEGDQRLGDKRKKDVAKEGVEMKQMDAGGGSGPAAAAMNSSAGIGFQGPQSRGALNSTPRNNVPQVTS